jgi:hypothetical protein
MSYPSTDQQNIQPSLYPDWYQDGSIIGLFLAIISMVIFWYVNTLFGFGMCFIALIIVVLSKKNQGRITIISIILSTIVFAVEIIFIVYSLISAYNSGLI